MPFSLKKTSWADLSEDNFACEEEFVPLPRLFPQPQLGGEPGVGRRRTLCPTDAEEDSRTRGSPEVCPPDGGKGVSCQWCEGICLGRGPCDGCSKSAHLWDVDMVGMMCDDCLQEGSAFSSKSDDNDPRVGPAGFRMGPDQPLPGVATRMEGEKESQAKKGENQMKRDKEEPGTTVKS